MSALFKTTALAAAIAATVGFAAPALAVDNTAQFELDGNIAGDGGLDWDVVNANYASEADAKTAIELLTSCDFIARTKVIPDPPLGNNDPTTFTGGRSDLQQTALPQAAKSASNVWAHTTGGNPDKDEITNAYAVALDCGTDGLTIYFGADRISTDGNAFFAFWFFQNDVKPVGTGAFSGRHKIGDFLVLVNFVNGGSVPLVGVFQWTHPDGDIKDGGTKILTTLKAPGSAGCTGGLPAKDMCAITNSAPIKLDWAYTPKGGAPGDNAPARAFFEGGIKSDKVLGSEVCLSAFLAETRTSQSVTASLKDFARGSFNTCGLQVTKVCTALAEDGVDFPNSKFLYELSGTYNSVRGDLTDVSIWEDDGDGVFNATKDTKIVDGLAATPDAQDWGPVDLESSTNGPTDQVFAVGKFGTADVVSPISNVATCPKYELDTGLEVTKVCRACLAVQSGSIVVTVKSAGTIKNTGETPLTNVKVFDDRGTVSTSDDETITIGNLAKGETKSWTGTAYKPATVNSTVPSEASFKDIVTATGDAPLNFLKAEAAAVEATCKLCPDSADTTGISCTP